MREKYFSDEHSEHFSQVGILQICLFLCTRCRSSRYDGNQMHWPKSLLMSLPVSLKSLHSRRMQNFEITKSALELEPEIRG